MSAIELDSLPLCETAETQPVFPFRPSSMLDYSETALYANAFSSDDMGRVLDLAAAIVPEEATLGSRRNVDMSIRRSLVRWIRVNAENVWLFEKVTALISEANISRYGFDLSGLYEPLQVAEYSEGAFFRWHKDHGSGPHAIRKLSLTVQLSDPGDYEGGEMEFLHSPEVEAAPKERGTAIIFPAYVMHRVRPITRGLRRSLVAWVSGPPFR